LTPEGQIVFIDFGIARSFIPKQSATRVVTAGYSPPEQYFGKPETRSDLYALGATLGHLLTGQRPKPLSVSAPRYLNQEVMLTLDDLVRRLTAHNVEDRPLSAREVRYELYRIYHEIHPDFEIPEEALLSSKKRGPTPRHGVMTEGALWPQEWEEPQSISAAHLQKITRDQIDRLSARDKGKTGPKSTAKGERGAKSSSTRLQRSSQYNAREDLSQMDSYASLPRQRRKAKNNGVFGKLKSWWEQVMKR
ncbi:MAG TPA: hypothetical protein V6C72_11895, partial [Chroococcales cyanobacterium]